MKIAFLSKNHKKKLGQKRHCFVVDMDLLLCQKLIDTYQSIQCPKNLMIQS